MAKDPTQLLKSCGYLLFWPNIPNNLVPDSLYKYGVSSIGYLDYLKMRLLLILRTAFATHLKRLIFQTLMLGACSPRRELFGLHQEGDSSTDELL